MQFAVGLSDIKVYDVGHDEPDMSLGSADDLAVLGGYSYGGNNVYVKPAEELGHDWHNGHSVAVSHYNIILINHSYYDQATIPTPCYIRLLNFPMGRK